MSVLDAFDQSPLDAFKVMDEDTPDARWCDKIWGQHNNGLYSSLGLYYYGGTYYPTVGVVSGDFGNDIRLGQISVSSASWSVWRTMVSYLIPDGNAITSAKIMFPVEMVDHQGGAYPWNGGWAVRFYRANSNIHPLDVTDWGVLDTLEGSVNVDDLGTAILEMTVDHTALVPGDRVCYMLASSKDIARIAPSIPSSEIQGGFNHTWMEITREPDPE